MNLDPNGREPYTLTITTQPAVTSWDASFDGGATWHTGQAVPGETDTFCWLVAGPSVDPGTAVAVISGWSVVPKVRPTGNPADLPARSAPRISVNR